MSTVARLLNAVPMLVLHSPAHRLLSGRYAVLEFTGRRSGRTVQPLVPLSRAQSRQARRADIA